MEQKTTTTILEGYSDMEKGAYLAAIASISSADRSASEEEMEYLEALSESADLSQEQKNLIRQAASDISGEDLNRCLDVLKGSDLRFSLVSDLIAFAESDKNYSPEEKQNVEKIATYLGVNKEQFSILDQFTKKAVKEVPAHAEELENETTSPRSFLDGLGFGDKLKNAGINSNSLLKGALGIMGPIILAQMFRGRRRGSGIGGGMPGRSGGMFGGGGGGLLGSLVGGGLLGGLLGGGRGFGGAGGLLGRVLGRNRF
ncbi:MAG TPA: TerB family tellurite resistance protein [Chitinophagaceae bacterium]|nr:TerB family tellurite resistance protein [Chitinophagaceae bacterium]